MDLNNTREMYTEVIAIPATVDINETLLQCAAVNINSYRNTLGSRWQPGVCYSRFAEIIGMITSKMNNNHNLITKNVIRNTLVVQ